MREEANVRVSGEREASLPKRGHAAEKEKSNRRQHVRFVVRGNAKGRVTSVYDAHILNISLGGGLD